MKTRIISALVAILIFIAVVYFLPPVCFTVAVSVLLAIAAYELTYRNGIVKSRPLFVMSVLFAAVAPFLASAANWEKLYFIFMFVAFATFFAIWLFNYGKLSLVMVETAFFAGAVIPMIFSVIVRIRMMENGEFMILFPFVAAWMTDTGAYFVGSFLGKHKLCEKISPKKTVEGAVGGVVVCILALIAFAKIMEVNFSMQVEYPLLAIGALVLSVLAQIGDLSFSLIKREYNIKDYGNLFPGHGGVLDRFDSTVFTIPVSFIILVLMGGMV